MATRGSVPSPEKSRSSDSEGEESEGEWVVEKGVACAICGAEMGTVAALVTHLDRDHKIRVEVDIDPIEEDFEGSDEERAEMEKVSQLLKRIEGAGRASLPLPPSPSVSEDEMTNLHSDSDSDEETTSEEEEESSGDMDMTEGQRSERHYVKMKEGEVRRLAKLESFFQKTMKNGVLTETLLRDQDLTRCHHCVMELPRGTNFAEMREAHKRGHETPGFYKTCPFCQSPQRLSVQLEEHLEELQVPVIPEGTGPAEMEDLLFAEHKCPETGCKARFPTRRCLLWHRTSAHAPFAHRCPHCEKPFILYHEMRRHIESAHNWVKRLFQCFCGKFFSTKKGLLLHKYHGHKGLRLQDPEQKQEVAFFEGPKTVWRKRAEIRTLLKHFEKDPKFRENEPLIVKAKTKTKTKTPEVEPEPEVALSPGTNRRFSHPRKVQLTPVQLFSTEWSKPKPQKKSGFSGSITQGPLEENDWITAEEDEDEVNDPENDLGNSNDSSLFWSMTRTSTKIRKDGRGPSKYGHQEKYRTRTSENEEDDDEVSDPGNRNDPSLLWSTTSRKSGRGPSKYGHLEKYGNRTSTNEDEEDEVNDSDTDNDLGNDPSVLGSVTSTKTKKKAGERPSKYGHLEQYRNRSDDEVNDPDTDNDLGNDPSVLGSTTSARKKTGPNSKYGHLEKYRTSTGKYLCPLCRMAIGRRDTLAKHVKTRHPNADFTDRSGGGTGCGGSGRRKGKQKSRESLNLQKCFDGVKWICPNCPPEMERSYANQGNLTRHLRSSHGPEKAGAGSVQVKKKRERERDLDRDQFASKELAAALKLGVNVITLTAGNSKRRVLQEPQPETVQFLSRDLAAAMQQRIIVIPVPVAGISGAGDLNKQFSEVAAGVMGIPIPPPSPLPQPREPTYVLRLPLTSRFDKDGAFFLCPLGICRRRYASAANVYRHMKASHPDHPTVRMATESESESESEEEDCSDVELPVKLPPPPQPIVEELPQQDIETSPSSPPRIGDEMLRARVNVKMEPESEEEELPPRPRLLSVVEDLAGLPQGIDIPPLMLPPCVEDDSEVEIELPPEVIPPPPIILSQQFVEENFGRELPPQDIDMPLSPLLVEAMKTEPDSESEEDGCEVELPPDELQLQSPPPQLFEGQELPRQDIDISPLPLSMPMPCEVEVELPPEVIEMPLFILLPPFVEDLERQELELPPQPLLTSPPSIKVELQPEVVLLPPPLSFVEEDLDREVPLLPQGIGIGMELPPQPMLTSPPSFDEWLGRQLQLPLQQNSDSVALFQEIEEFDFDLRELGWNVPALIEGPPEEVPVPPPPRDVEELPPSEEVLPPPDVKELPPPEDESTTGIELPFPPLDIDIKEEEEEEEEFPPPEDELPPTDMELELELPPQSTASTTTTTTNPGTFCPKECGKVFKRKKNLENHLLKNACKPQSQKSDGGAGPGNSKFGKTATPATVTPKRSPRTPKPRLRMPPTTTGSTTTCIGWVAKDLATSYVCPVPDCEDSFPSKNSLGTHLGWHKRRGEIKKGK